MAKLIAPVLALIDRPAGLALYAPPAVPVRVTVAVPPLEQYGLPGYVIVAEGAEVTVTFAVVLNDAHPPEAAIVYVTV